MEQFVELFLAGAARERLDPILDACVAVYNADLDEDGQVAFKGNAKAFVHAYGFLSAVLPYNNAAWEELSILLNCLMDSYRVEKQKSIRIAMPDADSEIDPIPTAGGGHKPEPELDRLSNIIKAFNDQFGNIDWKDVDKIRRVIAEEIPAKVSADKAYQNATKNSDRQNARIEHDNALQRVIVELLADHVELFKSLFTIYRSCVV